MGRAGSLFCSVCLALSVICVKSTPLFPLYTGFWPGAGHFSEADFPRLPKGYFTRIPIRSFVITNVPNHLRKNLFTLCGKGFIWHDLVQRNSAFNFYSVEPLCVFDTFITSESSALHVFCVLAQCRHGTALCQCCRKNKCDATLLSF